MEKSKDGRKNAPEVHNKKRAQECARGAQQEKDILTRRQGCLSEL